MYGLEGEDHYVYKYDRCIVTRLSIQFRLFEAGRSCLKLEHTWLASGQVTVCGELEISPGRRLLSFCRKEERRRIKAKDEISCQFWGGNWDAGGLSKEVGEREGWRGFSGSQEGNLHGQTATLPRLDVNPIEPSTHPCQPY